MSKEKIIRVGNKNVKLTNLDKVWWEDDEITKGEIVIYFSDVVALLLPHLKDRPLVLTRYPNGWQGKSFYQKNTPEHAPEWMPTVSLKSQKRVIRYAMVEDEADLLWLANQAAFEFHPFLSRITNIDSPDFAVFDLDPMENTVWEDVRQAALAVYCALSHYGLRAYPKTSGSEGLQIFVPLINNFTYDQVRTFTLGISQAVQRVMPQTTTLIRTPSARGGRLYLDYLQNVLGKTLVSVYAVRPKPHATVSTPVTWQEIEDDKVRNEDFTVRTIKTRLKIHGDLFRDALLDKQDIGPILRAWGGE